MRVIVIDDYQPFVAVIANILGRETYIQVVGQAYNGDDGLRLAADLNPDVVLVDFGMPGIDGATVTRRLKATAHPPKVVVISYYDDSLYRDAALTAGADACLYKGDLLKGLIPLLKRVVTPVEVSSTLQPPAS
ncbi:MAG: response regulator, partial [Gammaproteobacteria bacterium]